jgi:RNA polymerase sigma-70 factor (ECF subfamily)
MAVDRRSDEEVLVGARDDDEAFAVFYGRYEGPVLGFLVRAVGRGDVAADLAAEVFAELVLSLDRFDPVSGTASGWLFGITRNVLARARTRGRVEDRARRKLGLPVLALGDETIERIETSAADGRALDLLEELPDAQRVAVRARVVDELGYDEIARELRCSPSVARKRVSRGLASLRSMLKEDQ